MKRIGWLTRGVLLGAALCSAAMLCNKAVHAGPHVLKPPGAKVWSVRDASFWAGMPLPPSRWNPPSWVDARVAKYRLSPQDTPFDQIAWAPSFPAALQLARKEHRLVFLLRDRGNVFRGRA